MKKHSKFLNFISKLEQKMLDSEQESLIIFNNTDELYGGVSINDRSCTNSGEACQGSINGVGCSNSNCDNSTNRRRCTTIS